MKFKKLNYASALSFSAALLMAMVSSFELNRLNPAHLPYYVAIKSVIILMNIGFGIYFYKRDATDASCALLILSFIVFFLSMMWFVPLYEIAYFQCAIGAAFLPFKRPWIFPSMFFAAFCAVVVTYDLQSQMHWVLPEITRMDWIFTVFVFFALAWCIQEFAIHSQRQERDKLLRFSIIGKETTRLTHDLKGLLSSPLLILDSFRDKNLELTPERQERQMSLLIQDMDYVRETIRGIHRLVAQEEKFENILLSEVIQGSMKVLARRLSRVDIVWPEDSYVTGKRDRLHSVFFNLFLNSLEAFERNSIRENRKIEIFWKDKTLIFQDNAGGMNLEAGRDEKGLGSGLGLELVQNDLVHMNARFKIKSAPPHTVAEISFGE